jgi:hypothetical protein
LPLVAADGGSFFPEPFQRPPRPQKNRWKARVYKFFELAEILLTQTRQAIF